MSIFKKIPYWGVVALLIYMPVHVFLAQSLSLVTGGLEYWKIGKDVVLLVLVVFAICLVLINGLAQKWYWWLLGVAGAYGLMHLLIWAFHPDIFLNSALLGVTYNMRLVCFVILGASATLPYARMFAFSSIFKIVIGVSTGVTLLGIVQYFLPADFLTPLGYSLDRGVRAAFFIDDNPAYGRIMSTLRDPNSLGAYLILPLSALTWYMLRLKDFIWQKRALIAVVFALHLTALYLTFSRSAWLAAFLAIMLVVYWQSSSHLVRYLRKYWLVIAAIVVIALGMVWSLRNNSAIDAVITHSTPAQSGELDSNEYHLLFIKLGLKGIAEQPLGHGPGTAGLPSIHDPDGGLLTENYYVQIGYETGVIGLIFFLAINIWLYLHIRRRKDVWAATLLPCFWAYVLMNMLLHTWSNEAVAAQWWLLAGIALAAPRPKQASAPLTATKGRVAS